jgi:hypothetical protein
MIGGTDSSNYKSFINIISSSKLFISLGLNSDGASMWPLIGKIIELPDCVSKSSENPVFIGMWSSTQKPLYDKFLDKCIDQ